MPEQLPTLGRTVRYVLGHDPITQEPVVRSARVVRVWPDHHGVNLQVDLDNGNDRDVKLFVRSTAGMDEIPAVRPSECERGLAWRTSVAEGTGEGTWHWPPRAA